MFYLKILLFWKYSMLYFLLIWLKYYDSKFYINSDYTIFHFKIYKNYPGLYCKEIGYDHYFNIIFQCKHPRKRKEEEEEEEERGR